MSITAESDAPPTARSRLIKYLQERYATVPDNASAQQLRKLAQPWSGNDPIILHWLRQVEAEEQRAREQRDDRQQQEIAQRIGQRSEQQTVQSAQQQFETLDTWWDDKLTLAIGIGNDDGDDEEVPRHSSIAALIDAIGQVKAETEKALRHQIETANTYAGELVQAFGQEMKGYLDEVRTVVWSHFETAERRHNDAIEQVTQQLAGIEAKLSATHAVVDAFKELTDTLNQRIHELEVSYLDQHERDASQIKTLTERLTAIEHDSGNLRRDLADGHGRLGELEDAFWSQRGTDQVQRERDEKNSAEQSKIFSDRLTAVEQQAGDLKRAAADGNKRLDNLETTYWDQRDSDQSQRERDEKNSAEQSKIFNDRLTAVEQHSGDLKHDLADGSKQLNDFEATYWSQRDSDQRERDQHANKVTEKLNGFTQQVADFGHELKEVRRDLKRATDMTLEIHQMELRLDERRIAADKAKRGARGEVGSQGAKGDTGPAGKAGRDGHNGRDAPTIASWKTDPRRYAVAPMMSDGNVGAVLPLRELFEQYQRDTS